MRKTRKKQIRRDRRKAKASDWKRAGKPMGSKVGHGSGGSVSRKGKHPKARPLVVDVAPPRKAPRYPLKQQPFARLTPRTPGSKE